MLRFLTTLVWLSLAVPALVSQAADDKPKTDDRLKELLKRFPEADGNKDGVLTLEEAQAYRQAVQSDRDKKKAGAKKGQAAELLEPTHADVKYGPAERNVLDFYQ